jgi:hypothetical protein
LPGVLVEGLAGALCPAAASWGEPPGRGDAKPEPGITIAAKAKKAVWRILREI